MIYGHDKDHPLPCYSSCSTCPFSLKFASQIQMTMEATLNPTIAANYQQRIFRPSIFTTFFQWCTAQNENRLLWLGLIITAQGCILTPFTAIAVYFGGGSLFLFMITFIAMGIALVTNLAAMPTKYTLPLFLVSVVIDFGVVISCILMASL